MRWYHDYLTDAMNRAHRPIVFNHQQTRHDLAAAGFVDVQVERIRLPIGEWSRDEFEVVLGRWYRLAITEAVEALSLAPFTRPPFSWPVGDARRFIQGEVGPVLRRADIHAYNYL